MPQIIPITALRNTNEIAEKCHATEEPIFITKNGYGDMVIMSIETYQRDMALADAYKKLAVAERQIENGETTDAEEVFARLRRKHEKQV